MRLRSSLLRLSLVALLALGAFLSFRWATRDDNPRDFGSFWESGRAANEGDDPYGVYPHTFRVGGPDGPPAPNLNPPFALYPMRLAGLLDVSDAVHLWRYASIGLYALSLAVLLAAFPERRGLLTAAWALNLAGFWHTIELGQVYVPLLALTAGALLSLRKGNPYTAALLLGLLAAVKPNFQLWPALLVAGGDRRTGIAALGAAAFATAVPLVLAGPEVYGRWLAVTPSISDAAGGMARIGGNFSLIAAGGRFGVPFAGEFSSLALAGALTYVASTRRLTTGEISALAICATLLLGPVSWAGYSILLLPVLFQMRWTGAVLAAAALLCLPYRLIIEVEQYSPVLRLAAESVFLAAAALITATLLADAWKAPVKRQPVLPEVAPAAAEAA